MMLIPRPLVRNALFMMVCILFVFCIKDRIFDMLDAVSDSHRARSYNSLSWFGPIFGNRNESKRELILLQMLFRHGHRAPFMLYPTDPNNESFWKEGLGMLTRLGRLQHYRLGIHLQERYDNFITTNPKEVEMISAESARTQHGAYSFLAGLYSPKDKYRFTDQLRWQPIVSKNSNRYKNILTRKFCYRSEKQYKALRYSQLANDTKDRFEDLYRFWSIMSGRIIDDWHLANDLGKTFNCEQKYNLTIPEWAFEYWEELKIQTALNYYFHYGTKELLKYRIGPLMGFMIEKMNARIQKQLPEKRVYIYSAHGSYVAQILMILGRYNWREPPPASTIVVELWKEPDNDYSVRWLYFNSSSPEVVVDPPYILSFEECGGQFCSFKSFVNKTKTYIPEDYEAECNITSTEPMERVFNPIIESLSSSGSLQISPMIVAVFILYVYMNRLI